MGGKGRVITTKIAHIRKQPNPRKMCLGFVPDSKLQSHKLWQIYLKLSVVAADVLS